MTATELQMYAVEYYQPDAPAPAATNIISSNLAYDLEISGSNFVTLSGNTQATTGGTPNGFLYVPSLNPSDSCSNVTAPFIPKNITTLNDLPPRPEYQVAAFGPWTSRNCVFEYLNNAQQNNAQAFITYLPSRASSSYEAAAAPNASDPAWDLGDGGAWMNTYHFPVYALNSNDGKTLMVFMSNYSGSIETVPFGSQLRTMYGGSASVKLYLNTEVNAVTNGMPSLWVFLLIVLGILIGFLLGISVIMRIVQRRRRIDLRRRIIAGTVSIESLGIARIKVSEEILSKMPIYIYVEHGGTPGRPHAPPAPEAAETTITTDSENVRPQKDSGKRHFFHREKTLTTTSTLPAILQEKCVAFPQETCPICIDDFEKHVTPVRWLPCSHAFHPACIDPLLREYSSLCPICKASVLPKNYVPEVTNLMVRRERLQQRLRAMEQREREHQQNLNGQPAHFRGLGRFYGPTARNNETTAQDQQTTGASNSVSPTAATVPSVQVEDVEMQPVSAGAREPAPTTSSPTNTPSVTRPVEMRRLNTETSQISNSSADRRPENVSREEWARQRAETLVGTSETIEQAEQREEARRPIWRRALAPVFPNLR